MTTSILQATHANAISNALRTRLPARLREPGFWLIQALILAATLIHVVGEVTGVAQTMGELRHIPVTLYVVPIVVAALLYGLEGAFLSTLQCLIIAIPSISIWPHKTWYEELIALTLIAFVSNLLSWRIERESRMRRAAEELAEKLTEADADIRRYAAALNEAQEGERQHLARELHDSTLQDVLLLSRRLEELERSIRADNVPARMAGERLIDLCRTVAQDIRRYSRSLRPSILDDLGLIPALEWLIDDLTERTGLEANIALSGDLPELDRDVALAVFRIVQEGLRNVERHSGASELQLAVSTRADLIDVQLIDDGIGFDSNSPNQDGMGLRSMKERAVVIGGDLTIESALGAGTTVQLTFPAA
jgi:two-component system sensor histidine kinase DegS